MASDIWKLVAFRRGSFGCYTGNRFEQNYHYTKAKAEYTKIRHKAMKDKLRVRYVNTGATTTIDEHGFKLWISNEDKFEEEILGLGIEEVFYDCILKKHPKHSKKMLIAVRGKRGNRGPNLGVAGGESNSCDSRTKIQKPTIAGGSQRYGRSSKKMTELHALMHSEAGFQEYMGDKINPSRLDDFARTIHPGTIFEQDGYLYLVLDEIDNLCFLDFLQIHADVQTDPQWNFLSCAWLTFFCPLIGRYVTGMRTSSHKKSVPDYYGRVKNIGISAEKILSLYRDVPEYRRVVNATTLSPTAGDYFPDSDLPHYTMDSHMDPFVHIGVVVHTVFRLRNFLKDELNVKMSKYLFYEMVYSAFDESNNILRYAMFAELHFEDWKNQKVEPLPPNTSFVDAYQLWLRSNYPANDGIAGRNGGPDEGAVRYCANNNTARMNAVCHKNVRTLFDTIAVYSTKKDTETAYKGMLMALNKGTVGAKELKLQKMVYAIACCDDTFSLQWIRWCCPGSKEHFERLKEKKYPLESVTQVGQVLRSMVAKETIPAPVAEHAMCTCLSNKITKEVVVEGYDMFSCSLDPCGSVELHCIDGEDASSKPVVKGGFDVSAFGHYYPQWAKAFTGLESYGLLARFPNDRNLKFSVCEKSAKTVREEKMISTKEIIKISDIQSLLTKNRSLAIERPVEFVARIFQIAPTTFTKAIKVTRSSDGDTCGFYAEIDTSIFDKLQVKTVGQISDARTGRRPIYQYVGAVDITDLEVGSTKQIYLYKSEAAAILCLMFHLLTNVHRRDGHSWSFDYLQNTKELILLVPYSECFGTMDVVATLFRTKSADLGSPVC
jgi:hypothetical protein